MKYDRGGTVSDPLILFNDLSIAAILYYLLKGRYAMADFSERIKEIRLKNNLTQKEFARKVHVTNAVISKYENGLSVPSVDCLKSISRSFHISVDYLIGNDTPVETVDISGLKKWQRRFIETNIRLFREENDRH